MDSEQTAARSRQASLTNTTRTPHFCSRWLYPHQSCRVWGGFQTNIIIMYPRHWTLTAPLWNRRTDVGINILPTYGMVSVVQYMCCPSYVLVNEKRPHGDVLCKMHTAWKPCSRAQELCESRGGRPGLLVLMGLMVSADVKQHWTMLGHWSQFVPNRSTRHPSTLSSTLSSTNVHEGWGAFIGESHVSFEIRSHSRSALMSSQFVQLLFFLVAMFVVQSVFWKCADCVRSIDYVSISWV